MKKIIFTLAIMLTSVLSASAMSYEQAREQALFLTDKMAYELDLNESQYEAAYEVNLDYLMSVTTANDVYSDYWTRRNLDLSYILFDWQYRTFCGLDYFYRPLYWGDGFWHFRIFAHYPHHDFFYYGRPAFYLSYRGGHAWHVNGGRSWYHGRHFGDHHAIGMRGGYDRGGYRNMSHGWRVNDGGNRGFSHNGGNHGGVAAGHRGGNAGRPSGTMDRGNRGGVRGNIGSSTRETVGGNHSRGHEGNYSPSRSFGGNREGGEHRSSSVRQHSSSSSMGSPSRSVGGHSSSSMGGGSRSFGGGHSSSGSSYGGGSRSGGFSGGSHGGGHSGGGSHGGGHFGGRR